MSEAALTFRETYTLVACAGCAMNFAVPERFVTDRRRDHKTFYCPSGHSNYYSQKSEVERQRERAEALAAQLIHETDQRQAAELSARALRGHLTRLRNRIDAPAWEPVVGLVRQGEFAI